MLIPPSVLLHDLGYALATPQFSGRVLEFDYALFFGYAVPHGKFKPAGEWWNATSVNLIFIIYGLLGNPHLFVVRAHSQGLFVPAFARAQLGWAFVSRHT